MGVLKPTVTSQPACNYSERHETVKFIVMHETCGTYPSDLGWLTCEESQVSSDFYIRQDGKIWQLNPDLVNRKCWHAGVSSYQGYSGINEHSVGIEMEHALDCNDWPPEQLAAAAHLTAWLVQEFALDLATAPIVSHEEIALPPGRKTDPRDFPWESFGKQVKTLLEGSE